MIKLLKKELFDTPDVRNAGVTYYYQFFMDGEMYGATRYEATPQVLIIHPSLYKVNKTTIRRLREDTNTVACELADKFDYPDVMFISTNPKFVRLVSANKAKLIGEVSGFKLFTYELDR